MSEELDVDVTKVLSSVPSSISSKWLINIGLLGAEARDWIGAFKVDSQDVGVGAARYSGDVE